MAWQRKEESLHYLVQLLDGVVHDCVQKYFKLIEDSPLRLVGHNVLILESDHNRGFLVSFLLYNVTAKIGGDLILVSNTLIYFCEQNNGSRFLIYAVVLLFSVNIAIFV